tara:strand:- start:12079 stop:12780 length:702 start_codon:yes stop_codon:yes gene_type:complete
MSKVSFTPIQPGDVASITAPNATMTATATATAAVNAENVRQEGLDERSISFPLVSTLSHNSGDWAKNITQSTSMWLKVPSGGTWTGGTGSAPTFSSGVPFSLTLGTNFSYAVIRYTFEVRIEGRVGSGNDVNEDLGFALFRNNVLLPVTERHIQNSVAKSQAATKSQAARSVESVTLLFYHTLNGSYDFDLRYYIDNHGLGALNPDAANLGWVNGPSDAITISRLTASVIKYK